MNPNQLQGLEDEQAGIDEEEDDIDYDALYGGLDIEDELPVSKKEFTALETAKDVGKQAGKEFLIGLGGTWGDLAELAGVRGGYTKGQENRNKADFEALNKVDKGNPSFTDLYSIGEDDIAPSLSLPSSEDLRGVNEAIGGPGEAETGVGRYAGRTANLAGSGLAFGVVNPVPALAAGVAGQTAEELGAGPLAQAAAEISALILSPGQAGKRVLQSSAKREVAEKINQLRQLGYTEQDITLAINHASKGKKGGVKASKGSKTEQAFENFAEHSNKMVSDILTSSIPGIERGTQHVHQLASDVYGQVAQNASNLVIRDSTPFINSATRVIRELRNNLGRNAEAETFINRLHDAVVASTQNPTAENFMNFYQELNKAGNWMKRSQKDRLLTQVKDGIKDTFRHEGSAGRQLAEEFETANRGIRRAYQAEDVHDLIQKTATQDGIDYKKLNKLFDNPDNVHLFEDVLGAAQTRNLELISKTGKEVKDFDKAWKATHLLQGNHALDIARAEGAGYYLFKGNMQALATILATKGLGVSAKKIANKFLTDPKFQNLMIRGLHSLKNASAKSFRSANDAMKKYLDEEGIEIDLD